MICVSAPGPLLHHETARCLTYNPSTLQLILAARCDETMFYYDGVYIREAATHQCITPRGPADYSNVHNDPDSKVHGTNMGSVWGRQDPGGPHVGPMDFAIWGNVLEIRSKLLTLL